MSTRVFFFVVVEEIIEAVSSIYIKKVAKKERLMGNLN